MGYKVMGMTSGKDNLSLVLLGALEGTFLVQES